MPDLDQYTRACAVADVADGTAVRVVLDGVPVAVVRSDGDVYAIHDVCSHANVALSEGEIEGQTLECWLHGSRFDLRHRPADRPARHPARTRVPREDRRRRHPRRRHALKT